MDSGSRRENGASMPMSFVGKNDGNVKLLLFNQQQWGRG
ncbi:hypothetical protein AH4AK4_1486 [Aeromonas hydrophila 4AK4]|nr:hypothetical protein AH4AK4_1486 [Aeromonas hydrophila 4AK4]